MLKLKMKMCKKYSNCWYELNVIGEIFFIIMWRYKLNWSMNYLWIKYLIYMVKDCLYVFRSEWRSFEVYIFDYLYICILYDMMFLMIYLKW